MILPVRFFYDDNANEGAGGSTDNAAAADASQEGQEGKNNNAAVADAPPPIPEDIAKELEELRAFRAANTKEPLKSAEELAKEKEQDKADFIKHAIDNDFCNVDDITKYESVKVQNDADLVFPEFFQEFKEDNPDIVDEKELADAAKDEFESRYKISSKDESIKAKGLAKLAKAANEIRSPYETKVKAAEADYVQTKELRAKMPSFDKFVETQIAKNAPDKVPFEINIGKEKTSVSIEVELTKEDKEAIAKTFKTPKTFMNYSKSPEETEKALDRKIKGWIKENKFDAALEKAAEKFEEIGMTKGSNVGANNPYGLNQGKKEAVIVDLQSNQAANEARKRAANH